MGRRLSWPLLPLPNSRGDEVWRWNLRAVGELPAARAGRRGRLSTAGLRSQEGCDAHDEFVLAFDELASNALRHGETPVVATVMPDGGTWLLDVSDRAPDVMPAPAVDRDPALGGMGLQMVARLALAHGWYVDAGAKHVWARLPHAGADREPVFA